MKTLRVIIGIALLSAGLGWFLFGSPPPSGAQEVTVSAKVLAESSVSVNKVSLAMPPVLPGKPSVATETFTVTAKRNTPTKYKVMANTDAANFLLGTATSNVPASALKWTTSDYTTPVEFGDQPSEVFRGEGPTSGASAERTVQLRFECPPTAQPGDYSIKILYTIVDG